MSLVSCRLKYPDFFLFKNLTGLIKVIFILWHTDLCIKYNILWIESITQIRIYIYIFFIYKIIYMSFFIYCRFTALQIIGCFAKSKLVHLFIFRLHHIKLIAINIPPNYQLSEVSVVRASDVNKDTSYLLYDSFSLFDFWVSIL